MAVVYNEENNLAIYYTGEHHLQGPFIPLPPGKTPVKNVLLVRHPLERLKALYLASGFPAHFKIWFKANVPEPQSALLPRPDAVVRVSYFNKDMMSLSLPGAALVFPGVEREVECCLSTLANIRRVYYDDYRLGEYD